MLEVCGTFRRHIPFFNSQLSASPRTCGEVELTIGLPLLAWSNGNTVMLFGYESGTLMKKDSGYSAAAGSFWEAEKQRAARIKLSPALA